MGLNFFMVGNINQQSSEPYAELKSFKPYLGKKAPILIQIIGGLIWLAAAGLLLQGVFSLLFSPVFGIVTLLIGVFAIITGKSLFGMKKSAVRNSIIMAILFAGVAVWSIISTKFTGGLAANESEMIGILFGVLLILIVFFYRERFVN